MLRVTMLFWEDSEEEQAAIGSFVLRGRAIAIEPVTPDASEILGEILTRPMRTGKPDPSGRPPARISASSNPEAWMRALPLNFDGARVRAELEEKS